MKSRRDGMTRKTFQFLLAVWALTGCRSEDVRPTTGSETHFLSRCDDGDSCGEGLECLCGVCTRACERASDCSAVAASAACRALEDRPSELSCSAPVEASCEVSCSAQADCVPLGDGYRCDRGLCRQLPEACKAGSVPSHEVVLLGDLFLADNGQITSTLEALARDAGAIGADERYRDYSSTLVTPFGGGDDPATQYATARSEGAVRVVIMDAGGADALLTCPEPPGADCPALDNAVTATSELLEQMASDGVEDVVLFFYPDPEDTGLGAKFDVLRPVLQAACEASASRCHFLDLRPTFSGGEGLLEEGGILPTAAGSTAAAATIWGLMQARCIAQ
jgi:hypothetical protein